MWVDFFNEEHIQAIENTLNELDLAPSAMHPYNGYLQLDYEFRDIFLICKLWVDKLQLNVICSSEFDDAFEFNNKIYYEDFGQHINKAVMIIHLLQSSFEEREKKYACNND